MSDSVGRRLVLPMTGLLLALVVGVDIGRGRMLLVYTVLAVLLMAALRRFHILLYVSVLLSVSGFVNVYSWPRATGVPGALYLSEGLLLVAVLVSVFVLSERVRSGDLSMDWSWWTIAVLLVASTLGIVVGAMSGAVLGDALLAYRPMIYLLTLLPAVASLSEPGGQGIVIRAAGILAFFVSVLAVLQVFIGDSHMLFAISGFDALIRADPTTGFFRVRPPGLYLAYAATVMSASYAIWGKQRTRRYLALILLIATLACILVSLNRNMIVGFVGGLSVAVMVARQKGRVAVIAVMASLLMLLGVLVMDGIELNQPIIGRFASLLDSEDRGSALDDRAYESIAALSAVMNDPVVGLGWGRGYGALATRLGSGGVTTFERPWIHNQYLNMWVRAGLVGALSLIVLFVGSIVAAARNARWSPHEEEWLDLGLLAAITAFALSSLVDIVVANPNNLVVLIGLLALVSQRSASRQPIALDR